MVTRSSNRRKRIEAVRVYVRVYNRNEPKKKKAEERGDTNISPDRWVVRWKEYDGRWRERSAGNVKKDAEALADEIRVALAARRYLPWDAPPFSKVCNDFLEYKRKEIKPNTFDDYSQVISNYLVPYYGDIPISYITPQAVEKFKIHLSEKQSLKKTKSGKEHFLSASTQAKIIRVLRAIFRHPSTRQFINMDPTLGVRVPRQDRREHDYLNLSEVTRLLEASSDPGEKALFGTACFAGLRQGEIIALTWGDIDIVSGTIYVKKTYDPKHREGTPKTEKGKRIVPIPPVLVELLKEHKAKSKEIKPDDLVFTSKNGKHLDSNNLTQRTLATALQRAGIRKVDFQSLRHTFASLSIEAGTDPKTLQSLMGHSSINVTFDTYGHLFQSAFERHISGLEALISSTQVCKETP